ncbi:MAG: exodeoxyribonuclease I [Pseudomonadales bacterium]
MATFYWHDYETFGTDPSRDRPCQFAGIRTDFELNIIGEPLVEYCRPAADFLPQPMACLITGITPQLALQKGLPEADFIRQIHQELSQPGTCGVGYNSIRFDDEVTRYTLFRNFYDPYAREWQNGNSRWDLIDVVRLTYALRPEGINWPTREDGSPSFKLEQLTHANGIEQQGAHDALVDVKATIELARLIRKHQPKLFDYALSLRSKRDVAGLIDIPSRKPLLHISSRFPASHGCAALVVPLAKHPRNSNGVIMANLSQDPASWIGLSVEEIQRRLFTRSSDLAEGEERIGLKTVHLNRSPMLAPAKMLDEVQAQRHHIDLAACRRHWQAWKAMDAGVLAKVVEAMDSVPVPRADVDSQLYGDFIPDADKNLLLQVRQSTPEELSRGPLPFSDKRLPEILFRYRARNWPETLSEEEAEHWQEHCFQRVTDPEAGASIVMDNFNAEIEQLLQKPELDDHSRSVLQALQQYGDQLLA